MARKQNKGGGKRQRAKQRAQYDELDKYPVMPPHAFARIVRDKQTLLGLGISLSVTAVVCPFLLFRCPFGYSSIQTICFRHKSIVCCKFSKLAVS